MLRHGTLEDYGVNAIFMGSQNINAVRVRLLKEQGVKVFAEYSRYPRPHGAKIQAAYDFNNIRSTAVPTPTGFLADGDQFTLAFLLDY